MEKIIAGILVALGLGAIISAGFIMRCFIAIAFGIIGIFVWPYTINTWLVYFGKVAEVVWWHGFLIGSVFSFVRIKFIGIFLAVLTWIVMMFLK